MAETRELGDVLDPAGHDPDQPQSAEEGSYHEFEDEASARSGLPAISETPGQLGSAQLNGENLSADPDWPAGWWLSSYFKMHKSLLMKARIINDNRAEEDSDRRAVAGQENLSVQASMKLLWKEVFSLCPKKVLASGMWCSVCLVVFSFWRPYFQGKIVDKAISGDAVDEFALMGPLLVFYALLEFGSYVFEVVVGILFAISGHTTVTRLRIKLFRNLIIQETAFFDSHVSGELSSRLINDSASLSSLMQFTTQTMLGAFVKFIGALVAMYWTHPSLAFMCTVITPVSTLMVRRTGMVVGQYGTVQNEAMAKANALAVEVLGSVKTVQSNVGETQEAFRFMDRMNRFLRVIVCTVYLETALRFVQYGLSKCRDMAVLVFAMHQVIHGELTVGQYFAFAQYCIMYEDGFKNISDIWLSFKQTVTSTGKFVQLLRREPRISADIGGTELPHCTGAVTFVNVSFSYAQRPTSHVLADINLKVSPGDVIALVGESGAGKSTFGRLLLRCYDPCSGQLTLDGVDFRDLKLWWLRAQIGVVEQEPVLFDRSIAENIAYGSAQNRSDFEIWQAAQLARAHDFITEIPGGYNAHAGEKAARISGGQKQRVAIARAIIREPKILLLDEATSALDSENEYLVQKALDDLMRRRDATTFIIAHRLSTVKDATRILVLHKGCVVEEGSHTELIQRSGKYASFMEHQLVEKTIIDEST